MAMLTNQVKQQGQRSNRPLFALLPPKRERLTATAWVQSALRAGQVKYYESDKDFPARIWYRDAATNKIWIGYCLNSVLGQYKGWPADESERLAIFD